MTHLKKCTRGVVFKIFRRISTIIVRFLGLYSILILFYIVLQSKARRGSMSKPRKQSNNHFTLKRSLSPLNSHTTIDDKLLSKEFESAMGLSTFHKKLLKSFINDYVIFHSKNRRKNSSRFLVFRPFRTGLGDRIERLMMAYYAAVVSERIFLIDWQYPSPIEDLLETASNETDFFFRKGKDEYFSKNGSTLKHKQIFLDNKEHDPKSYMLLLLSKEPFLVSSIAFRASRSTLEELGQNRYGATNSNRYTSFLGSHFCRRAVLHHVIRIRKQVLVEFEEQAKKIGLGLSLQRNHMNSTRFLSSNYISVHARIGTGVGENENRFVSLSNNLEMTAQCLASRAVNAALSLHYKTIRIFLATDTPSFRPVFDEKVKLLSRNQIQVFHGNWEPLHSNHLDPGRRHAGSAAKYHNYTGSGMWSIYMDLVLLGSANHIIALKSSFSRFAFAIGTANSFTDVTASQCLENDD